MPEAGITLVSPVRSAGGGAPENTKRMCQYETSILTHPLYIRFDSDESVECTRHFLLFEAFDKVTDLDIVVSGDGDTAVEA